MYALAYMAQYLNEYKKEITKENKKNEKHQQKQPTKPEDYLVYQALVAEWNKRYEEREKKYREGK